MFQQHSVLACAALLATATIGLAAQAPDSSHMHLERARALAGLDFLHAEEIQCGEFGSLGPDPYTTLNRDDRVTPTQLFDNLYYVGTRSVGAWVVRTPQGLVLVNALHTDWVKSTLVSGMKKLKLDPADVKYVLVTEPSGADFGGARYFQSTYGTQIVMSEAGWDAMSQLTAERGGRVEQPGGRSPGTGGGEPDQGRRGGSGGGRGGFGGGRGGFGGPGGGGFGGGGYGGRGDASGGRSGPAMLVDERPNRDAVALDGEPVILGDETLTVALTPGSTAGTMSVIVPVTDHGTPHVALIVGGTRVPLSAALQEEYAASMVRLADVAARAHADVVLTPYPFLDDAVARMDSLRRARPGTSNPFVVGESATARFLAVLGQCDLAQPARH